MSPTVQSAAVFPRVSVQMEREELNMHGFGTPHKVPDPAWRFVDDHGHGHFWVESQKTPVSSVWDIPTTKEVVTGTQWVGDEYDGVEYEIKERRCLLCGEVIEPGMKLEYPKPVLGPTTITVTINGEAFIVNEIEYAATVDQWAKALRMITR